MSALDRAIIRAFHRPETAEKAVVGVASEALSAAATRVAASTAVPLSRALADLNVGAASENVAQFSDRAAGSSGSQAAVAERPKSSRSRRAVKPVAAGAMPAAQAAAAPTVAAAPIANTRVARRPEPAAAATSVSSSIGALLDRAIQPELPPSVSPVAPPIAPSSAQSSAPSSAIYGNTAATMPQFPPSAPMQRDGVPASFRYAGAAPAAAANTAPALAATSSTHLAPPPAQNVTTGSAAVANAWRPFLQVDRVVWPAIHGRLQSAAQSSIEQMADGLQKIADSGRRVIGLASCAGGEGVTTLLTAAARTLLGRGKKVAVVDGNWGNPQLAKSLGLLPQIGWEDSLSGGLPLEEVAIESLADGLAVLPVRQPPASAIATVAIAAGLEILAREFDLVLTDLGPLADKTASAPSPEVTARMDAVVLVQNVRSTPPNRLAEVREQLAKSNVRYAGTIQNFVA